MKNRLLVLGFILVLLVTLSGCTGTKRRLNCICLIDYSASRSEKILENYVSIICNNVFKNFDQYDRLIVLPVDEGAKTESVKLVYEDLALHEFVSQQDGFAHAREKRLRRIKDFVSKASPKIRDELIRQRDVRKKFIYYTDVLSAVEQAQALLETEPEDTLLMMLGRFILGKSKIIPDNVIILFSDMILETHEYNFSKTEGVTPQEESSILALLKDNKKIPKLNGCKVFVTGRTANTNIQVENIKKFWEAYFKETGAEIMGYDFDCGAEITAYLLKRKLEEQ